MSKESHQSEKAYFANEQGSHQSKKAYFIDTIKLHASLFTITGNRVNSRLTRLAWYQAIQRQGQFDTKISDRTSTLSQ